MLYCTDVREVVNKLHIRPPPDHHQQLLTFRLPGSPPVSPRSSLGPVPAESLRSTSTLRDSPQHLEDFEDKDGSETSLSRSVSSTSFMSAISEQEDFGTAEHEDFGLVNLHIQVGRATGPCFIKPFKRIRKYFFSKAKIYFSKISV